MKQIKKEIKKEKIIFWILIIIGISIRIYNFPTAIQELNTDEIMTIVNAKSIADTGKEIGGISLPVYLQGWGGQSVVLLYLMVLSIKLLGYTLFAIRLPMLIISIISLFVFYDLIKKITKNKNIALIGLALVCFSPWHVLQSIYALDCNMFPHFLLFAIDLLYTGISNKKNIITYISMIFFAICLYCYGVAIYFIPLFLIITSMLLLKKKILKVKDCIICIIIFLTLSAPIITMFTINALKINQNIEIGQITIPYYEGLSRTKDMLFFSPNIFKQLGENIYHTLRVIFLQKDGAEWNAPELFGATFRITIIFAIIGIIKTIKDLKQKNENVPNTMLITWISISTLTGILINEANINRLNSIWYIILIFGTIGIYEMYELIRFKKTIMVIYAVIFTTFVIYFHFYYTDVVANSGCFSRGFYQALNYTKELQQTTIWYDNIKNDGCLELYIRFDGDDSKEYKEIKDEEELKEKIKNIDKHEILILDIEKKQYDNLKNTHQIGDFLIIVN